MTDRPFRRNAHHDRKCGNALFIIILNTAEKNPPEPFRHKAFFRLLRQFRINESSQATEIIRNIGKVTYSPYRQGCAIPD